jgi:TonB family protein
MSRMFVAVLAPRCVALALAATLAAIAFSTPSRADAPLPLCSVRIIRFLPMPDAMHYALVLTAKAPRPSNVRLTLYSDTAEYHVNVEGLTFDAQTQNSRGYQLATRYVALPRQDYLVAAKAVPLGTTACSPTISFTAFFLTRMTPDYVVTDRERAFHRALIEHFEKGAQSDEALLSQPESAAQETSCRTDYRPARAVNAASLDYPKLARIQGISGTALVEIELDQTGAVVESTIYKSSGSPTLDAAALSAANRTKYSPLIFHCEAVGGTYLFKAVFGTG